MHHNIAGSRNTDTALRLDYAHIHLPILRQLYPGDFAHLSDYTTFTNSCHPGKQMVAALSSQESNCLSERKRKRTKRYLISEVCVMSVYQC